MTLQQENYGFIALLDPSARWAATQFHDTCFGKGLYFKIMCTKRTQEEQNHLLLQGRMTPDDFWNDVKAGYMTNNTAERGIALLHQFGGKPGIKVTWTLDSLHITGLAMDIQPINTAHPVLEGIAADFGITHPIPSLDPPHYELNHAEQQPSTVRDAFAIIRRFERMIAAAASKYVAERLQKRLDSFRDTIPPATKAP